MGPWTIPLGKNYGGQRDLRCALSAKASPLSILVLLTLFAFVLGTALFHQFLPGIACRIGHGHRHAKDGGDQDCFHEGTPVGFCASALTGLTMDSQGEAAPGRLQALHQGDAAGL